MAIARPLTVSLLKKLFLLTRKEFDGGKKDGFTWGNDSVIASISEIFPVLGKLDKNEVALAMRAAFELERDGFIQQDRGQSQQHKVLTQKGKNAVSQSVDTMKLPSIDIGELLSRDDLREAVRDDFNEGDFETAVFKAFRLLETSVRAKAGQPAAILGTALMAAAFGNAGNLTHPTAAVPAELEGLHALMRGAIAWFKNPSSHRIVPWDNEHQAAHALAFANLLLDLLHECTVR